MYVLYLPILDCDEPNIDPDIRSRADSELWVASNVRRLVSDGNESRRVRKACRERSAVRRCPEWVTG